MLRNRPDAKEFLEFIAQKEVITLEVLSAHLHKVSFSSLCYLLLIYSEVPSVSIFRLVLLILFTHNSSNRTFLVFFALDRETTQPTKDCTPSTRNSFKKPRNWKEIKVVLQEVQTQLKMLTLTMKAIDWARNFVD